MMKRLFIPLLVVLFGAWLSGCYREPISTNPAFKLEFSVDTLAFDTVFTNIGSATRSIKVYNRNNADISVSSVRLAGGDGSVYRMNVDGRATSLAKDVYLRSKDSLFVFVEVTIDPNENNAPLLVMDSIIFETNGNHQDVKLISWGQDVHMFSRDTLHTSTTFVNDKPYLIYDYLYVPAGVELTVEAGVEFYLHNTSWLFVEGRILFQGQPDNPITMQGDRLEMFYRDKPGQWGGIWLTPSSHSNSIDWTVIQNSITGINISPYGHPTLQNLKITNSIIKNTSYTSIDARGAIIEAGNCLFANAKEMCLSLGGGSYSFTHCTVANYWAQYINRSGPAVLLANYFLSVDEQGINIHEHGLYEATFENSIIYGSRSNEIDFVSSYFGMPIDGPFNYSFSHTIVRTENQLQFEPFPNISFENPLFKDPFNHDFRLKIESPAIDAGDFGVAQQYPVDVRNVGRLVDQGPDLGAYEWIEEDEAEEQ